MTDRFDELYTKLKPSGVTASTMIAKAVALTLARKSFLNSCYVDGAMKHLRDINIAMAVAIPGGLITPTLKNADKTDIFALSRTWKDLVDRAKLKKLSPEEYSSGTFTISNLGMFGVSQFDAILPPGTGAILAIAASLPRVMQLPNGYFGVQKFMTVTVTADHRHIYGAHVAEFLTELASKLYYFQQYLLLSCCYGQHLILCLIDRRNGK
jgi:pyruvate dehydrogenase E2 component (dihydrolipoamide acetyltransferase)